MINDLKCIYTLTLAAEQVIGSYSAFYLELLYFCLIQFGIWAKSSSQHLNLKESCKCITWL